jgi:hypothetical protein
MTELECRDVCTLSCEAGEQLLTAHPFGTGGALVFSPDGKATFRPQRRGNPVTIAMACIPK